MAVVQLIGQGAFVLASLALGVRLLRLWRRTGGFPELTLGISFLVGGGLGYLAWFVLAGVQLQGGSFETIRRVALVGLAFTAVGALSNGVGVARIFRPGARWPFAGLVPLAVLMGFAWMRYLHADPTPGNPWLWVGILACAPIYLWAGVEAALLGHSLHKRARLGLADPVVVNRVIQWGISGLAVVGMIALGFAGRLLYGPIPVAWVSALSALLGLVAATTIWLGFFPPQRLRERLGRAYAS